MEGIEKEWSGFGDCNGNRRNWTEEVKEQDDGSSFPLNEEILDRANKLFEVPSQDENMIIIKVNE